MKKCLVSACIIYAFCAQIAWSEPSANSNADAAKKLEPSDLIAIMSAPNEPVNVVGMHFANSVPPPTRDSLDKGVRIPNVIIEVMN